MIRDAARYIVFGLLMLLAYADVHQRDEADEQIFNEWSQQ